jgi:hypothetical protein
MISLTRDPFECPAVGGHAARSMDADPGQAPIASAFLSPGVGTATGAVEGRDASPARRTVQVHDADVTKRRFGGWLLLGGLLFICVGGVVRNSEHAHSSRTIVKQTTYVTDVAGARVAVQNQTILAGPTPSHTPAFMLFIFGGVAGLVGAILMLRAPTVGDDGADDSG